MNKEQSADKSTQMNLIRVKNIIAPFLGVT